MTPQQFKGARLTLGLTPEQIAPLLALSDRARIYEIEGGKRNVSKAVGLLVQAYLDGYRPANWPASSAKEPT